ncbi:MAG TPA: SusD/RagB family nutrient-binding outer membrane lipoprotein, partial [Saprospiraceae bacterium]|nr:SusD/RagB family nutrient-binding outer membrane lipoprotein [Saprospiraceae bacterium]
SRAIPQSASELKLSDIMLQKYIALYAMNSCETWTDMRRYDYSDEVYIGISFPTSLFPDNQGKKAYRVRPRFNSEYVWNLKSLDVIGGNDADYHTKKPWFAEK